MRGNRRIMLILALAAAALAAGCGGSGSGGGGEARAEVVEVEWLAPPRPIRGLVQRTVGEGPRAAIVLWREGTPPSRRAVVFLHAWLPLPPFVYASLLRHLAVQGNSVVYPVYQRGTESGEALLDNALSGIDAGLRTIDADPRSLVAFGQTVGGALAFDYAAAAAARGVLGPRGVLAINPGRYPPGGEVPAADLSRIPARTLLQATVAGRAIPDAERQARALLRGATQVPPSRRRFFPSASGESVRGQLDRLINAVRGEKY